MNWAGAGAGGVAGCKSIGCDMIYRTEAHYHPCNTTYIGSIHSVFRMTFKLNDLKHS